MDSYALASSSGLKVGFYFFLTITAAIAFMLYGLLTVQAVHRRFGISPVRKVIAAPFATLVWIVLFSAIYLSSFAGFHTVTLSDEGIRCTYSLPGRSTGLRYSEIGDIVRRPAYKTRWRLYIYTVNGGKLESATGSYRDVKEAADAIERRRSALRQE